MVKWKLDACGVYFEYKGYVVIRQDHPRLCKYEICIEKDNELIHVTVASTIKDAKDIINSYIKSK